MIELTSENMSEFLDDMLIEALIDTANNQAKEKFGTPKEDKPIIGSFLIKDLKLADEEEYCIWVEFIISNLGDGIGVVTVIHKIYLYTGDFPDELLDRFNEYMKVYRQVAEDKKFTSTLNNPDE